VTGPRSSVDLNALWAKWSSSGEPDTYHPLPCHLADVAAVAKAMWEDIVSPGTRRRLAAELGLCEESAGRWISFLVGLHDLGKASPAFQMKKGAARPRLEAAKLQFRTIAGSAPHGAVSTLALRNLLGEEFDLPREVAGRVATAVGGHHGIFPSHADVLAASGDPAGKGRWVAVRADLAAVLAGLLDLPRDTRPSAFGNAAAMKLAGLVSVADWIGSDETYFHHQAGDASKVPELDPEEYWPKAQEWARDALRSLGWTGWPGEIGAPRTFRQLFPEIQRARPVQEAVAELAEQLQGPALVVVEAPMGEGKTEAAMHLADHWGATLGQRGCYFALPTQATSDQMFERVRRFLSRRYPDEVVNLQLTHGHAALSTGFGELRERAGRLLHPGELYDEAAGADGAPSNVIAAEWFTRRKRALLAPFGVGTVDQALLAALQTRHGFVRLFGLAGKTVIVDEAHAYDAYMTTLLARLLEWLGALGSPVVILSATLPRERRTGLVAAYARGAGWAAPSAGERAAYPRLSWVAAESSGERRVETSPQNRRELRVEWVDGRLRDRGECCPLAVRLREALAGGGCAAVLCNTVSRAQALYRALKPHFPDTADDGEPELDLLHARYLYEDRQEREARALLRFGRGEGTRRPHRAVLVATQVIEQSLDIDFDLMVSDHAPADLLLQRAGRLHRHERERPPGLGAPARLWVCEPWRFEGDAPSFDPGTQAVYDRHILLRSWLELRDRESVRLPDDIEAIVEAVYDDARECPPELGEALRRRWDETRRDLLNRRQQDEAYARPLCVLPPNYDDDILQDFNQQLEEDAPHVAPSLQALTRLSAPTVPVVFLESEAYSALRRGRTPDSTQTKELLKCSTNISGRHIVSVLMSEGVPSGWLRSALLRHHRLVGLDEDRGVTLGERYRLQLDPELGVIITSIREAAQ
jgi:CRISPR-associated endonuclease/helicase Cas3